ncbi:Cobalt-precorrin-3 C(17)-methyltransferase [hydrothermal vent metagenome]|uniref:Cobalt-precorrin-3 C(17)-methyltransferase n=1 Tax=hydrothermal vent metagenome TaxID=652676 RepID=A0A3B1CPK7_9ZZZZ
MVVGYTKYVELVADIVKGKEVVSTGMTKETERCQEAIRRVLNGETVALISSGDPGVYGMAGLAIELASQNETDIPIEVIPGVSAANSAAARLGAPLALDFAAISLSDLLVEWSVIRKRLNAAAESGMVTVLYNPKSKKRVKQIEEAVGIFRKYRADSTPVGICDSISLEDEKITITDLGSTLEQEIGMRTTVIIGNSESKVINGRFVNPRGYRI